MLNERRGSYKHGMSAKISCQRFGARLEAGPGHHSRRTSAGAAPFHRFLDLELPPKTTARWPDDIFRAMSHEEGFDLMRRHRGLSMGFRLHS